jgi:hypothetical protein
VLSVCYFAVVLVVAAFEGSDIAFPMADNMGVSLGTNRSGMRYTARPTSTALAASDFYVFRGVYAMNPTLGIYHSTVIVCPSSELELDVKSLLDGKEGDLFEVPRGTWSQSSAICDMTEYGGGPCTSRCCGVNHQTQQFKSTHALFGNKFGVAATYKYYIGKSSISLDAAYDDVCTQQLCDGCESYSGSHYVAIPWIPYTVGPNCNTFVDEVLKCAYGFDDIYPGLGLSDFTRVGCDGHHRGEGEIGFAFTLMLWYIVCCPCCCLIGCCCSLL